MQLGICHFSRLGGVESGYHDSGKTWSKFLSSTFFRQWTHLPGPSFFAMRGVISDSCGVMRAPYDGALVAEFGKRTPPQACPRGAAAPRPETCALRDPCTHAVLAGSAPPSTESAAF